MRTLELPFEDLQVVQPKDSITAKEQAVEYKLTAVKNNYFNSIRVNSSRDSEKLKK